MLLLGVAGGRTPAFPEAGREHGGLAPSLVKLCLYGTLGVGLS